MNDVRPHEREKQKKTKTFIDDAMPSEVHIKDVRSHLLVVPLSPASNENTGLPWQEAALLLSNADVSVGIAKPLVSHHPIISLDSTPIALMQPTSPQGPRTKSSRL